MEKYYSLYRPVMPGSYPKPEDNDVLIIENFDDRQYVEEIDRWAWGFIEYESPLPDDVAAHYEFYNANSPTQDFIVDECSRLLDAIEEISLRNASNATSRMDPAQIDRKMFDSGVYNLFSDYKEKPGFNMELLEDGGIQISCLASGRESITNRDVYGIGQFSFGSAGSFSCLLEPTPYTEKLAEAFHFANSQSRDLAITHFNQAFLYNHDRIDVYYLSDDKNEHIHSNEKYENALWVWHSDQNCPDLIFGFVRGDKSNSAEEFRCIGYNRIGLNGLNADFYYIPQRENWDIKENINFLEQGHNPIYFHSVRLEYKKGKNENLVSRFTCIDNFKVNSELDINLSADRYFQNELPLISIAVPFASELSKLPHEGDILTVLCTEPSDLSKAVEENLSAINPHSWELVEKIQQDMSEDKSDDFQMNKPEVEAEPEGRGAR